MAGRFEFESPGAAFTSEIAKVLTERKAEERQRLLDSLQFSADARAEDQARRQNALAEQQMAQNKQEMDLAKARGEREEVSALAANRRMGDNPEDFGYSPEQQALLQKYGYIHDVPVPQVNSSETFTDEQGVPAEGGPAEPVAPPTPKMRKAFVGSQKEQEEEQLRGRTGQVIASLLQDPKRHDIGLQLANAANANNGVLPIDVLMKYAGPDQHIQLLTPSGGMGKTLDVGPNTSIHQLSWGPRELRQPQPVYFGVGADGQPIWGDAASMPRNPDGTLKLPPGIQPRPNGNGSGVNAGQTLGIPNDAYQDHTIVVDVLRDAADEEGKVDASAIGRFRSSSLRMIGSSKASDVVKNLAKLYVTNPQAYVQAIMARPALTQKDIEQLDQLKSVIAPGPDVETLIKMNPVPTYGHQSPAKPGTSTKPAAPGKTISELMKDNQGMS